VGGIEFDKNMSKEISKIIMVKLRQKKKLLKKEQKPVYPS